MAAARRRKSGRARILLLGGAALLVAAATARAAGSRGLLQPSAPRFAPDLPVPAPLDASSIAAPLAIPVRTLSDVLERAVPVRFGSLDERIPVPGKARTSIAFRLTRQPFRVSFSGDSVRLDATIAYTLRAWYDPPLLPAVSTACGADAGSQPRLRVVIAAPLHIGPDWKLTAKSRVVSVARASDAPQDRCRMTFLDFDVTDRVVDGARRFLEAHTADLDQAATSVDLRGRVEGWWTALQQPVHLADSVWLVFRPETVRRAPTRGSRDSLEIVLALRAHPGIVMGPRPAGPLAPLPTLEEDSIAPGLHLLVDAVAGYEPVTAFLQQQVGGAELRRGTRTVKLDSLRVFGIGGGRLAMEVQTSGDVVSRFFLTGTPRIDTATGQFSIPDLDYDVRTRSVMFATLSWLGSAPLRQMLRDRASWPATPAVGWLRDRLEDGLNRNLSDELSVTGDVREVRILAIYAMRDALLVRAQATANARLAVRAGPRKR